MKIKKLSIILFSVSLMVFSCKKEANTTENTAPTEVSENSNATSLEQKPIELKNEQGEKLTLVYFAEGKDVAVKLKRGNEPEHKLIGKATNDKGEPIFTDGIIAWEMSDDGRSGKLTEKGEKVTFYK